MELIFCLIYNIEIKKGEPLLMKNIETKIESSFNNFFNDINIDTTEYPSTLNDLGNCVGFIKNNKLIAFLIINNQEVTRVTIMESLENKTDFLQENILKFINTQKLTVDNQVTKKRNIYDLNGICQYLEKEEYENALKRCYQNNNWSGFENRSLYVEGFKWFKKAPAIHLRNLYAKNSGLKVYEKGFKADYVDQSYCPAKTAPNCTVKKFIATNSLLAIYPKNFKADYIDQKECLHAKKTPNCKVKFFMANDSGLEEYTKGFHAFRIFQSHCENAKVAPNFSFEYFDAANSGLETYPPLFHAKHVNQNGCENAEEAPNITMEGFSAKNSGLKRFPKDFSANVLNIVYTEVRELPNIELIKLSITSKESIDFIPEKFEASIIADKLDYTIELEEIKESIFKRKIQENVEKF